jgi:hypothetical protein
LIVEHEQNTRCIWCDLLQQLYLFSADRGLDMRSRSRCLRGAPSFEQILAPQVRTTASKTIGKTLVCALSAATAAQLLLVGGFAITFGGVISAGAVMCPQKTPTLQGRRETTRANVRTARSIELEWVVFKKQIVVALRVHA